MPRVGVGHDSRLRNAAALAACGALAVCVLAAPGGVAQAQVSQIAERLTVHRGATCLTRSRLAAEAAQSLRGEPIAPGITMVIEGSETERRNVVLNVLRDGELASQRPFEPGPERCDHLHAVVGLAIAFAFKAARRDEPPAEPEDATPPLTRRWSLGLFGVLSDRMLPSFAPGLELSGRYRLFEHVTLRLGALGVTAFDIGLEQQTGSFDAVLIGGRLDGCARARLAEALHGGLCVGVLGAALRASGADVDMPRSSTVPALSAAGALELELALTPHWSIALGGSITWLLHGVEVGVEGPDGSPLGRRELASPALALGIGPVYNF